MPKLKLSYFDFNGGRGEVARLALTIGKIPFEDDRIPVETWPSVRDQMPLHALPVLQIDGERITQSNAINRYVGRLAGLYPENPIEALRCDEVMDAIEDILAKIVQTFGIQDEEAKRAARQKLAEGPISLYLAKLDEQLAEGDGMYFADARLTVADLKVCTWIQHLRSGTLDHVPTDLADRVAPHLVDQFERIKTLPEIAAYYAGTGAT
jgi:glutathione S-transferase